MTASFRRQGPHLQDRPSESGKDERTRPSQARCPYADPPPDAGSSTGLPLTADPRSRDSAGQPEPRRTRLIAAADGPGTERTHPITSSLPGVSRARNTSPVTPSIAAATTNRACTSSPTLVRSVNTGASTCRHCRTGLLLGNPRDCERGPGPQDHQAPTYRLALSDVSYELQRTDAPSSAACTVTGPLRGSPTMPSSSNRRIGSWIP